MNKKVSSESVVRDIHRKTRKKYSSEEKIRIVLEGFQSRMSAIGRFLPSVPSLNIQCAILLRASSGRPIVFRPLPRSCLSADWIPSTGGHRRWRPAKTCGR